jgi:protein translocase SecG subunit
MKIALTVIQIILSVILSILIFLQSSDDSESRSNIMSSATFEKRGWERIIFYITITVLILFLISSIIQTTI